jgi:hypothetical protein
MPDIPAFLRRAQLGVPCSVLLHGVPAAEPVSHSSCEVPWFDSEGRQ